MAAAATETIAIAADYATSEASNGCDNDSPSVSALEMDQPPYDVAEHQLRQPSDCYGPFVVVGSQFKRRPTTDVHRLRPADRRSVAVGIGRPVVARGLPSVFVLLASSDRRRQNDVHSSRPVALSSRLSTVSVGARLVDNRPISKRINSAYRKRKHEGVVE
jgi:hypothetical protein